jgi:PAS domain S-box-containing protein
VFDRERQGWLRLAGLIPVISLAVLAVFLVILDQRGAAFDIPYLVFVLQFIFVFLVSIMLTIVSARAYLLSGSLNILLLGIAPLLSGTLLIVAQWAVTPSLGSTLTTNEAVTIGNIGILLASVLLFLSAILLWTVKGIIKPTTTRRAVLAMAYLIALAMIVGVILTSDADLFPIFFTTAGSTIARQTDLGISGILLAASAILFGWKYWNTRSTNLYWYTLGLVLFCVALIGIVFTVKIGDPVNWSGRIGLYLTGIYFLIAVLSRDTGLEKGAGIHERWAEAFRNDPRQVANLFANITNAFAYGKIITDRDGNPIDLIYLDVNRAFEKENKVSRADVLGRRVTEVFPTLRNKPGDWIGPYGRAALDGESTTFEWHSPISGMWKNIFVYSPKKDHFVAISEDITERKKAEEAIKEERDRLNSLINSMNDEVWVADAQGKLIMINPAVTNEFGLEVTPDGIAVQKVASSFEAYRPDGSLRPPEEAPPSRALRGEVIKDQEEIVMTPARGELRYRLVSATPFRDANGQIIGSVSVVRDITDRKKAEDRLKRSNVELQQFAYVSSHDLQEPLRMVISYLSLLDKKYKDQLDPNAQEYLHYAVEGGMRMRELIDDLLEYSRVDTQVKEFGPVLMNEVVEDVIKVLKAPIDEGGAKIFVDPLPTIIADRSQMVQVMQNLIGNAIKFRGKEKPTINVSASRRAREWLFSIKDNGIGLNMQYSDKIFEMFQRLHAREEYPGTGVGLAVAKKIIERHGGRIWVESKEGKGATFFFTIPIREIILPPGEEATMGT